MTQQDIAIYRLQNQQVSKQQFLTPAKALEYLGAVQAQDYAGSKWSIGLRTPGATDALLEKAIGNKAMIRTWAMRGTLQLVSASAIHFIIKAIGARAIAVSNSQYKKLGFDEKIFAKSKETLVKALEGGKQLTRKEITLVLKEHGFYTEGQGAYYLLHHAALEGLICLGARNEKEFTYTLLEEWGPAKGRILHEEALAWLAGCYFTSRGPATLKDFVWWSGLTVKEAKMALDSVSQKFSQELVDGEAYWFPEHLKNTKMDKEDVYLLPGFDEYILAYSDKTASVSKETFKRIAGSGNGILSSTIIIDGQVAGTWKREFIKGNVEVNIYPFEPLSKTQTRLVDIKAAAFAAYCGLPLVLQQH